MKFGHANDDVMTAEVSARNLLQARLKRFRQDDGGSLIIFGLILLLMMFMVAGMAVDVMRVETTRTQIQNTLDRAVLAAADLDQTEDAKAVVIDYFDKAGLSQYLDADTIFVDSSKAAGQLSFRRVSATASADVKSMFLKLVGIDTITAAAAGAAEEGITDLEISLVLDVSGSMGWSSSTGYSKIYELRKAAKDFVYYMQCNPNATRGSGTPCSVDDGKVSVTMVPYAEQVTAGATLLNEIDDPTFDDPTVPDYAITDEHQWSDCVTFVPEDFATSELSVSTDIKRTGHFDPWTSSTYASDSSRTCRLDSWREIQPFMDDYNEAITKIGNLSAGGNTSIDVGMKWGTALLDPQMQNTITGLVNTTKPDGSTVVDSAFDGRPYPFTQDYSLKVVVLMTDGVNTNQHYLKDTYREGPSEVWRNTYDSSAYSIFNASTNKYYYTKTGAWNDAPYGDGTSTVCYGSWWRGYYCYQQSQPGAAVQMTYQEVWKKFSTDWYDQFSWLGSPISWYNNSTKNAQLDDICDAAKDEGIVIYAIGFEVDENADSVMASCATTPGHYFSANGANLAETFGVIASSINQLRLTQ